MKNKNYQILRYIFFDSIAAIFAWFSFFVYRKKYIESLKHGFEIDLLLDQKLVLGLILIPVFWVSFYALTGYYAKIYRRSRLNEIWQTLNTSLIGSLFLFFALILNDNIANYIDYYKEFLVLFLAIFVFTIIGRLLLSTLTNRAIQMSKLGFNTLIVGTGNRAAKLLMELENNKLSQGFFIKGFIGDYTVNAPVAKFKIPVLGNITELETLIKEKNIEEIIIALEENEQGTMYALINQLSTLNVYIKVVPDLYSILTGMVRMNNVLGTVLIEIDFDIASIWQRNLKRIFDIVFSTLALVFLFPIMFGIALLIKFTNKGPVFYKQERIGYKGKAFNILKFRTMINNAEKGQPQLSKDKDPRITRIGLFLRKTRLDELPQFFNVLIGEMSVVGPRPERKYFIDQIIAIAPYYKRLHRVKPGITSWGQVKYGYAENVDQMVERLRYDILYIENLTLALDVKIILYTVIIMIQGRGK